MPQLLALVSAVFFGAADFLGGVATRRLAAWPVATWTQIAGLPILVLGLVVIDAPAITQADVVWGAAAGVVGFAGLAMLYASLAAGVMSVVAPIIGAGAAFVPVVFAVVTGESITAIQWVGIVLALAAVTLLAREPHGARLETRLVLQALGTALAFGVFFIMMGQTGEASGVWPLAAARIVSIPIGVGVVVFGASGPRVPTGSWVLVGSSGVVDMAANVSILLAVQRGPIGVNAVLSSLYPVFTVAAAIVFLRERPSATQGAGIGVAVAAILALAL
jgi:drug/metabolite transporter (DMT)-like permease